MDPICSPLTTFTIKHQPSRFGQTSRNRRPQLGVPSYDGRPSGKFRSFYFAHVPTIGPPAPGKETSSEKFHPCAFHFSYPNEGSLSFVFSLAGRLAHASKPTSNNEHGSRHGPLSRLSAPKHLVAHRHGAGPFLSGWELPLPPSAGGLY